MTLSLEQRPKCKTTFENNYDRHINHIMEQNPQLARILIQFLFNFKTEAVKFVGKKNTVQNSISKDLSSLAADSTNFNKISQLMLSYIMEMAKDMDFQNVACIQQEVTANSNPKDKLVKQEQVSDEAMHSGYIEILKSITDDIRKRAIDEDIVLGKFLVLKKTEFNEW